jgi:hypothetical protein
MRPQIDQVAQSLAQAADGLTIHDGRYVRWVRQKPKCIAYLG